MPFDDRYTARTQSPPASPVWRRGLLAAGLLLLVALAWSAWTLWPQEASPAPLLVPATSEPGAGPYTGMWLDQAELDDLPRHGAAWQQLLAAAREPLPRPDIGDQDDMVDVYLLAKALVYARTGEDTYRAEVLAGLADAMGSEGRPSRTGILGPARNLPPYVIAADLIDLPEADPVLDAGFRAWLQEMRTTVFDGSGGAHSLVSCHETRPNNFGTHCGAARVAVARYLGDTEDLERAAAVFHGWLGARDAYAGFEYGRLDWQADPDRPVGVNPPGAEIEGHPVGGALPEEMRRGGRFEWPPDRTGYAWEAMQGAVVQAELLHRAGYPAWEWEEQALLRAARYLYEEVDWEPHGDDEWQPWLLNAAYDAEFASESPAQPGKNMAWTDWTHAPYVPPPALALPTRQFTCGHTAERLPSSADVLDASD